MFTPATNKATKLIRPQEDPGASLIAQYGLVGMLQDDALAPEDRLVLANLNVPWSAFICGSQGAGKSHTVSCFLENALAANQGAGELSHPLAGLVMHYDHYSNFNSTQLCEAAYLCSAGIPVNVLVSPSNIWAMRRLYANLPGLPPDAPRPRVLPLYLEDKQLDISRILKLMAVNPNAKKTPLYMDVIMDIARTMAMEGPAFTYSQFRSRIDSTKWISGQEEPLSLRLQLLDTFMKPSERTVTTKPAAAEEDIWNFPPGSLTIVDLSDPFISSDDACTLFSIALSIFLEERSQCGRIVVLDEAHKFLTRGGEAEILTRDLTSVIRQQRHTGTRVVIATQEPTLSPELIDLANVTVVHRFLSPSWYEVLRKHLAGVKKQDKADNNALFESIVRLRTGEAFLFCPTAQLQVDHDADGREKVASLGDDYVKFKVRKRLTADGGKSILATDTSADVVEPGDIDDIPMYTVGPKYSSGPFIDFQYARGEPTNMLRVQKKSEKAKKKQQQAEAKARRNEEIASSLETAGDVIDAAKAQALIRFETKNWRLWQAMGKKAKMKLYEDTEAALELEPGTITKDKTLRDLKDLRRDRQVQFDSGSAVQAEVDRVQAEAEGEEQDALDENVDATAQEEDATTQEQEQDTVSQEEDSVTQDHGQDSTAQEEDSLPQEQEQEQDSTAQEEDPTVPKDKSTTPPEEEKI
ncbi:hypothetical protein SLS62_009834 [Diatrype stigma]|uniref:Uncharacterized protein n=1 Tax=Diatrype stigma TaxID=117547 RepID=A0AAN9YK05_9PEZI